jgi:hypothetical protein
MNNRRLGLINYEGDVLAMVKAGENRFEIYDQWNKLLEVASANDICDWLDGNRGIVDSEGRTWYWDEHHRDAQTPIGQILQYIQ